MSRSGCLQRDTCSTSVAKPISHIRGPEISPGIQRLKGYMKALSEKGIKMRSEYVVAPGDVESPSHGADAMRRLLALTPRPDGVFCFNDPLAMCAMKYILD